MLVYWRSIFFLVSCETVGYDKLLFHEPYKIGNSCSQQDVAGRYIGFWFYVYFYIYISVVIVIITAVVQVFSLQLRFLPTWRIFCCCFLCFVSSEFLLFLCMQYFCVIADFEIRNYVSSPFSAFWPFFNSDLILKILILYMPNRTHSVGCPPTARPLPAGNNRIPNKILSWYVTYSPPFF